MFKRTPPVPEPDPDPFTELEATIILAREQSWAHHNVPETERETLRPSVRALASAVAGQLREERATRTAR